MGGCGLDSGWVDFDPNLGIGWTLRVAAGVRQHLVIRCPNQPLVAMRHRADSGAPGQLGHVFG